jgi:phage-related protein
VSGPTTPASESGGPGAWQFFRASTDGRCILEKELDRLPRYARAAMIVLMSQYVSDAVPAGAVKRVRDNIFELRWRQGNNHFRILFFRWGPHPVALSAFYKNQRKTPKAKIETALDRLKAWKETFGDQPPQQ